MAHESRRSRLILRVSLAALAAAGGISPLGCSGTESRSEGGGSTGSNSAALVVSSDLVISQVYGGGGNSGATYAYDFVEIFNRGSAPASLDGKSLQYASGTVNFSATSSVMAFPPGATVPAGGYYLVQLSTTNSAVGGALPTPDFVATGTGALALAKDKGKVALVDSASLLDACGTAAAACTDGAWVDFVGYGTSGQAEGSSAQTLSNTLAAMRLAGGCQDTGNNSADFQAQTPLARNSTAPTVDCTNFDAGIPAVDSGAVVDSGATDSGTVAVDSGAKDAGTKTDSGSVVADAGGSTDDDAGSTPSDAGSKDAGKVDAGVKKDAGKDSGSSTAATDDTSSSSGGCSVTTQGHDGAGSATSFGMLGLALAAVTRRRKSAQR